MDADAPRVRYEKRGRVAYVTIDRPHVLNAMDLRTHEELGTIWDDFATDDDLWVAVLTGAGERAFSTGQDLGERASLDRDRPRPTTFGSLGQPGWPRLTERFDLAKPVVARVSGYALGGGFELALACDVIVASRNAVFGLPEARLGLVPGAGGVFRLARQLPLKTAMGYLLTGRHIPATRALELGLVNEVVAEEELDGCVAGWIEDLLRCAPLAVRAIKQAALRSLDMPLDEAFAARYEWEDRRSASVDAVEGPRAFVERRTPVWQGR
jgi:dehydration protein DpgD